MSGESTVPTPGSLVELDHAGNRVLGLVRGVSRGLLEVVTEAGDRLTVSLGKILNHPGFELTGIGSAEAAASRVSHLRRQIDEALDELDLHTIWQLLDSGDEDPYSIGDLTELWFGELDPVGYLAIEAALRKDTVYFKRRGGEFATRNAREVEAARQQLDAESRRHQVLDAFIEAVASGLAGDAEGARTAIDAEPELRARLELIHDYAALGERFERRIDAIRLLESIAERVPVRSTIHGAFNLLLRLGVVSEHENLALRRYRIRTDFEPSLLERARQLAAVPPAAPPPVEDLTDRPAVTIDDGETRDFDDALHVTVRPDGSAEVGIHISDVGALIEPGAPLDLEARKRGSSVYLPTGVIPMLPPILSENRLSLLQGELRRALSFLVEISPSGEIVGTRVTLSTVRVTRRLTYDEADEALEDPSSPLHTPLVALEAVARRYGQARLEAGAIDIQLPEVTVRFDDEGQPGIKRIERSRSRALIGEMMVLAGEKTADFCLTHGIPTVFRTQDIIDEEAMGRLVAIQDPLVRDFEAVRFMRRGELRSEPSPHRGLGLDAYVQATSPIRRYADLVVNYQLRCWLGGAPLAFDAQALVELAATAEAGAQACSATQRDSERYWLLEYLRRSAPDELEALVLHHDPKSTRPTVPILLTETLLRANLHARGLSAGERIRVRLVKADPRRDVLKVDLIR